MEHSRKVWFRHLAVYRNTNGRSGSYDTFNTAFGIGWRVPKRPSYLSFLFVVRVFNLGDVARRLKEKARKRAKEHNLPDGLFPDLT